MFKYNKSYLSKINSLRLSRGFHRRYWIILKSEVMLSDREPVKQMQYGTLSCLYIANTVLVRRTLILFLFFVRERERERDSTC